jgi:hypothetical protein
MPMSLRRSLPLCLVAVWLAGASLSAAAAPPSQGRGNPAARGAIPAAHGDDALSDSVRRVERSTRSQVLSAERVPFDGRDVNRIKTVDANGRVRVFMDDPRNTPPPDRNPPTRGNDD